MNNTTDTVTQEWMEACRSLDAKIGEYIEAERYNYIGEPSDSSLRGVFNIAKSFQIKNNTMTQPNDLRIGNVLRDKLTGTLLIVDLISIGSIGFAQSGLPKGWQAEPIPITEEWLMKAGFSKTTSDDVHEAEIYSIQIANNRSLCYYNCEVTQMETGAKTMQPTWFFDYEWNHCISNDGDTFWNTPKYVHQLQNLYFSLTGQELNIEI